MLINWICSLCLFLLLFCGTAAAAQDGLQDSGRVRIQLVSVKQTTLSAEISAKISGLPLREGKAFTEGETLLVFDCALLQSQLNRAEASAEGAQQTLKVNKRLLELNSISNLEVEQAATKVKETAAEVAAMKVTVSKCVTTAPFSGRIAKLYVEAFQYVTTGKPLMDILDTKNLEVNLIVPSKWLSWIKAGSSFSVLIEELNRTYSAKVVRTGARIDPLSQSIQITGEITGDHPELLPGMSGWASFRTRK